MSLIIEDRFIIVKSPISDKEISRLPISPSDEINQIIAKTKLYERWSSLSLSKRCYYINVLRKSIVRNQNKLHDIIKNETGKKDFDIFIEIFGLL